MITQGMPESQLHLQATFLTVKNVGQMMVDGQGRPAVVSNIYAGYYDYNMTLRYLKTDMTPGSVEHEYYECNGWKPVEKGKE